MTADERRDIENTGRKLVKAGFVARIIGELITITVPLGIISIILFNIMLSNDTIPNNGMIPIILAILFLFKTLFKPLWFVEWVCMTPTLFSDLLKVRLKLVINILLSSLSQKAVNVILF
jgi:hypothetical protein